MGGEHSPAVFEACSHGTEPLWLIPESGRENLSPKGTAAVWGLQKASSERSALLGCTVFCVGYTLCGV